MKLGSNAGVDVIDIHVTYGVEDRPPDIWLQVDSDLIRRTIVRLTIDEARELARLLTDAADTATTG